MMCHTQSWMCQPFLPTPGVWALSIGLWHSILCGLSHESARIIMFSCQTKGIWEGVSGVSSKSEGVALNRRSPICESKRAQFPFLIGIPHQQWSPPLPNNDETVLVHTHELILVVLALLLRLKTSTQVPHGYHHLPFA